MRRAFVVLTVFTVLTALGVRAMAQVGVGQNDVAGA
jgi:hypothetical protein